MNRDLDHLSEIDLLGYLLKYASIWHFKKPLSNESISSVLWAKFAFGSKAGIWTRSAHLPWAIALSEDAAQSSYPTANLIPFWMAPSPTCWAMNRARSFAGHRVSSALRRFSAAWETCGCAGKCSPFFFVLLSSIIFDLNQSLRWRWRSSLQCDTANALYKQCRCIKE